MQFPFCYPKTFNMFDKLEILWYGTKKKNAEKRKDLSEISKISINFLYEVCFIVFQTELRTNLKYVVM